MRTRLDFRQAFIGDTDAATAYGAFLREVFGFVPQRRGGDEPAWVPFAMFADGRCVAGIEAGILRLVIDGQAARVAAIRLAGVAATHRGQGLFRALATRALAWSAAQCRGPVLLYTEEPALYTRFGFRALAQHAFVGAAPEPAPGPMARTVGVTCVEQFSVRLGPSRAPVSNVCAILGGVELLCANLRENRELAAAHAAGLDALIVYEVEDEVLVVVDVVAATMPTLAQIVGALRLPCARVRTLFPPDRLAWQGTPEPDDTGLMILGAVPAAMTRPFMLPPTTAF